MNKSIRLLLGLTLALGFVQVSAAPARAETACTLTVAASNTTVSATAGADLICVTGSNNTVNALGGDDTVLVSGDDNTIYLGLGADTLDATEGSGVTVDGGPGSDTVSGSTSVDTINGGDDKDRLLGAAGDDQISGGAGDDRVFGGDGNDTITGGDGEDIIDGDLGDDTLVGGEADDVLNGGDGADNLAGEAGEDSLAGDPGDDVIDGGADPDLINGGAGDDELVGGAADDTLYGGEGADYLAGNAGDDELSGQDGDDTLSGGDGSDTLVGGTDNDNLVGGEAGDTINGGEGTDNLSGDAGPDNLYGEAGTDTLSGGEGDDIIAGGDGVDGLDGGFGLNKCDYTATEPLTATCIYDDFGPEAAVRFVRSSVEVGAGPGRLDVTVTASDDTAIQTAYFACYEPSGTVDPYFGVLNQDGGLSAFGNYGFVEDAHSGDNRQFSLSGHLTLPMGSRPGQYFCTLTTLDTLGNRRETLKAASFTVTRTPPGMPGAPTGVGYAPDSERPTEGALSWFAPEFLGDPGLKDYQIDSSLDGNSWTTINDGYSTTTSLPLRSLKAATSYWFRVRADNGGNSIEGSAGAAWSQVLTVRTPDPLVAWAPTGLKVSEVASTSAALSWTASAYNGGAAITDFRVNTSRDNGTTWSEVPHSTSTSTSLRVTGLAAGTAYMVRVSAKNSVGFSPAAEVGFTTTKVASGPPVGLAASGVAQGALMLTWGLPVSNGGAAITDYKVEFSSDAGRTWRAITHTASAVRSFKVTGLTKGVSYRFRVSAVTSMGTGSPSSVLAVTVPTTVPGTPSRLAQSGLTSSKVTLAWSAPTDNGGAAISDYKVELSRDDGTNWKTVPRAASTARSMTVTGMAPGTTYAVRVSAKNAVGYSAPLEGSLKTLVTTASAPTGLTVTVTSPTTMTLKWGLPASNGGLPITDYRVRFSRNSGRTWRSISHTPSPALNFNVAGLTKGVRYRFRVAAVTSHGAGTRSSTVTALAAVRPSAPINLTQTGLTSSRVNLDWTKPASNGGSSISDYKVEVSRDNGVTWKVVPHRASNSSKLTVSGLAPGTTYQVRVSAKNGAGYSDPLSGEFTTQTTTPSKPTKLSVANLASTTLTLKWELPASNGGTAITDYRIEFARTGGTWRAITHVPSASRSFNVTGLTPGLAYQFRLSAINDQGTSPTSDTVKTTTPR